MAVAIRGSSEYLERFWSYVYVDPSGCWNWTGGKTKGYGVFHARGRTFVYAYAFAWELANGIPAPTEDSGLELDHTCRNRACLNPSHLELVTSAENTRRGNSISTINREKTHCLRGHSFEGCLIRPDGTRVCRICYNMLKKVRRELAKKTAA